MTLQQEKSTRTDTKKYMINEVYKLLKNRTINPDGTFDSAGRFYLKNNDLINQYR